MTQKQTQPPQDCISHFKTSGTFYEVGYNTSARFKDRIHLYFKETSLHQSVVPLYDSQAGRDYYEETLRVCQDCYPQYVREVRGIADGAGLPFEHVFMANVYELNLESKLHDKDAAQPEKANSECGCSTLFINSEDTQLVLHNEDYDPLIKNCGYLLSADIQDDELVESFTALTYPGSLPGRAFGFNHHGLCFTSNILSPAKITRGTPSRIFHCRALLNARNLQDAIRMAKNDPYGTAYGFSINLATKEGLMTSLELGPGMPQAQMHVQDVPRKSNADEPCHYYHFNKYRHLKVEEEGKFNSSIRRGKRADELPPPRTLKQALQFAADTHDQDYPIFRTPSPTDKWETVVTAVFDLKNQEALFFNSRAGLLSNAPVLKIPMFQ